LIPPDRLSQSGDAWSRVKVMYDDRVVNNVYILRVKIRNTGTVPIKSETMHKNFRFWFSAGTQLLAPAVIPQPVGTDDISVNLVEYNDGAISSCEVAFDLLNAKEEIDLQFVCAGTLSTPTVTGKIIGGTIREEFSQRLQRDMMEISKRTLYELASTLPLSRFFMFILDRVTHSWK
jgi:hypothetical protein